MTYFAQVSSARPLKKGLARKMRHSVNLYEKTVNRVKKYDITHPIWVFGFEKYDNPISVFNWILFCHPQYYIVDYV